jgi:hypothetical protein
MKKLRLFYSWAAICPENFRTRRLCHNSSHRSPKFIVLDLLERRLELQNNLLFAHGTSLVLDENLITTAKLHR